jgi:GPH family glycoside/pentoside/hexuronide:cation symporter
MPSSPVAPRLSTTTQVAYGTGDFGPSMAFNVHGIFFFFFLTHVAHLQGDQAGFILFISNLLNAGSVLLSGILSDATESAWGRRRSWMMVSSPLMAVSFILQWWIPPGTHENLMVYYLTVSCIFQITSGNFLIPYQALLTDLTTDKYQQEKLNSWRFIFTLAGSITSLVLMQVINYWIPSPELQLEVLGVICGVSVILSVSWCCLETREVSRSTPLDLQKISLKDWYLLLCNQRFLSLLGIFSFSWVAAQITPAIWPYFIIHNLGLPSSTIAHLILMMKGSSLLALFFWEPLSLELGKKKTLWMGGILWLFSNIILSCIQATQAHLIYLIGGCAGWGMATAYLIPPSLLPEVIDWEEQQTGQRYDGLLNSLLLFVYKIGLAFGLYTCGQILSLSGFDSVGILQSESTLLAIRQWIVNIPSFALVASLGLAILYPTSQVKPQLNKYLTK